MTAGPRTAGFRQRLLDGDFLLGSFVKTPSPIICEVMALTGLDAVCLDAEHAPFGPTELDACIAALRAADMPALVRLRSHTPADILGALDSGAIGIVVPHVQNAEQAAAIARAAHFGAEGRGYAGSSRAAGFTTEARNDVLAAAREQTTVIVQIEDPDAVANTAAIAAVDGIDCVFVGRVDLTVALGCESVKDAAVIGAVETVCAAGVTADCRVGMFTPDLDELPRWRELGSSLFLLDSDHGFLLSGARALLAHREG